MTPIPFLLITSCILPILTATPATPLVPATSQSLTQSLILDLDTAPLIPTNLSTSANLTAGSSAAREVGCYKPDKNWPETRKEDCERVLDHWVKRQDLSLPRIFSRTSYSASKHRMMDLPLFVRDGSCRLGINVLQDDDEEVVSLADIYANVLGPDGLAKTCLGQIIPKALGGRMLLGPRNLLSVTISGVSIQDSGPGNFTIEEE